MRKWILGILSIMFFLGILSFYIPISIGPLNRKLVRLLEERLNADIKYSTLKVYIWRSLVADGIEVIGRGGFALKADSAVIDYDLISIITGRLHVTCNLSGVKFYKTSSIMNSLTDLLHIRPLGGAVFHTVNADLYVGKNDTLTRELVFLSDKIKILGNAVTDRENNIMCFLYFYFRDDIVKDIPKEIQTALLKKEEGPWYSIYVGVMGNYRTPILRIMTDRFRMNISSKSGG